MKKKLVMVNETDGEFGDFACVFMAYDKSQGKLITSKPLFFREFSTHVKNECEGLLERKKPHNSNGANYFRDNGSKLTVKTEERGNTVTLYVMNAPSSGSKISRYLRDEDQELFKIYCKKNPCDWPEGNKMETSFKGKTEHDMNEIKRIFAVNKEEKEPSSSFWDREKPGDDNKNPTTTTEAKTQKNPEFNEF